MVLLVAALLGGQIGACGRGWRVGGRAWRLVASMSAALSMVYMRLCGVPTIGGRLSTVYKPACRHATKPRGSSRPARQLAASTRRSSAAARRRRRSSR